MSDQGWTAPGGGAGRPEPQPPQQPFPPQPGFSQPGHPGWGQPRATGPHPAYPQPRFQQPPQRSPYVPPRQLDFRPGIIPLRPLTMNDLFGAVFRAVRGNVAATVGLAALTSLVFLVPFTALGAWVSSHEESITLEESVASGDATGFVGQGGSLIPQIGSVLSTILLAGFLAYVIGQAVLGRKISAGETWRGTIGRIWALIGATLLTLVIYMVAIGAIVAIPVAVLVAGGTSGGGGTVAAGFGLLVLAGLVAVVLMLFLWTRLAFVTPSIVLENLGVGQAFSRSWRLTGGNLFWRLLGIRILAAIGIGIVGSLITAPLAILAAALAFTGIPLDQMYVWQAVITGVTGVIAGALTTPITAGLDALLYVDHRIRREGLDVQLIQTAQGSAGAPWPRASA